MIRAWLPALFLLLISGIAQASDKAVNFDLPTSSGRIQLDQHKGKVVYVDFWASWCVPCRNSFPWMNQMQKKYKGKGLEIIAINLDKKRELADTFLREIPANFTIAFDPEGKTAEAYKVMGMPSSYLINRKGEIVYKHIGFQENSASRMEAHISEALKK